MEVSDVINTAEHPIDEEAFRRACFLTLQDQGVLVIPGFLTNTVIERIREEGETQKSLAYYTTNQHNVFLSPPDPDFSDNHPRNRKVISSKGCITTDQLWPDSALKSLYDAPAFRDFLCAVLGEAALYEYADLLSSINLHYAAEGQELGWHFDNSSFATTLLIQKPEQGGVFEYVKDVRNADLGDMNYPLTGNILDGEVSVSTLSMDEGDLVLFRGRNSIHRVTPVQGDTTRMLAVLAYNSTPGVALSDSASKTFYGR